MRVIVTCWILFLCGYAYTQDTLSYEAYIKLVYSYHPIAKQAALLPELSLAIHQEAKGQLDPELTAYYDRKSFDQKEYFDKLYTSLEVPTRLGIDIHLTYENNGGDFLNRDALLPQSGLVSPGLTIPIGKGLLYDKRRATIDKAKIYSSLNENERQMILNDLVTNATFAYIDWYTQSQYLELLLSALDITQQRKTNTIALYTLGDIPAIDTLEAHSNLLSRQQEIQAIELKLIRARLDASSFLWDDNDIPTNIPEKMLPAYPDEIDLLESYDEIILTLDLIVPTLPAIRQYNLKLETIEVDRKLLKEDRKPKLDIMGQLLLNPDENRDLFISRDHYKIGIDFAYPLLNRSTRGALKVNEIAAQQEVLSRNHKVREIRNYIEIQLQRIDQMNIQIRKNRENIETSQQLLSGEREKFRLGESSVFVINKREEELIKSQKISIQLQKELLYSTSSLKSLLNLFLSQ